MTDKARLSGVTVPMANVIDRADANRIVQKSQEILFHDPNFRRPNFRTASVTDVGRNNQFSRRTQVGQRPSMGTWLIAKNN